MTDFRLSWAILGAAAFFCIAPGGVVGLAPYLITGWRHELASPTWVAVLGVALVIVGVLSLVECFARFVIRGHGTPAPVAPPRRLVVTGQYRYVRNPMYLALVVIVLGQAAWFGSRALVMYAVVLWLLFHLRVVTYEEPRLARQFGGEFAEYRQGVPRWLPRVTPWRSG